MESTTFLLLSGITTILVCRWALSYIHRKALRLPPGPRRWPIIGNLNLLGRNPHQSLMALSEKHGPLMYLRLGSKDTVVVSSPDMAREFLKSQDKVFASRPQCIAGDIFFYGGQDLGFAPLGDHFRAMRKIFVEQLFTAKRLGEMKDMRREEIVRCLKRILDQSSEGKPTDMGLMMIELAFNNITRMVFNKTYYGQSCQVSDAIADEAREFHRLAGEWAVVGGAFIIGDYIAFLRKLDLGGWEARLVKLRNNFRKFLIPIMDEHRQKAKTLQGSETANKDFVDILLSMQITRNNGNRVPEDQMIALIQDLLVAGTEPIGSQLVWTLAELMRHPEVLAKLRAELDGVLGRERMVEDSDLELGKLPYLQAVVRESIRLHTVVPLLLPHESIEDTKVDGYHIPKKTRVLVNAYAIARDPTVWKNPLDFDPTRFIHTTVDVKGQDFELLPFGAGRRICPAANMGVLMVELTLAHLLQTCEICLPAGVNPRDIDMEELFGLTTPKKTPLELIVTPRVWKTEEVQNQ